MSDTGTPPQPSGVAEAIAYLGIQIGMLLMRVQLLEQHIDTLQEQLADYRQAHEDEY